MKPDLLHESPVADLNPRVRKVFSIRHKRTNWWAQWKRFDASGSSVVTLQGTNSVCPP